MEHTNWTIISLGGSLVAPDTIDVGLLRDFTKLISDQVLAGKKFVVVVGGGKLARKYGDVAKELGVIDDFELHRVGIAATRLNAELVRVLFGAQAESFVLREPTEKVDEEKSVIIAGGWQPGASTDNVAALFAERFKAPRLINLSNIDYVYDKDPRAFSDAQKIEIIRWNDFMKLMPHDHMANTSAPFDPVASQKCASLGIEVVVMNGKNISNLQAYLDGNAFIGTTIK
jgi:uridylate kinase